MTPGSLIGFAAVFVLVTWLASALAWLALPRVARRGAEVERRAAFLAAALPALLGVAVAAALVGQSLWGRDHCGAHGHHAHLCLAHGAAWAERWWAMALLAIALLLLVGRSARLARSLWRGAALDRELSHALLSRRERGPIHLVPSPRPFCFVVGVRRPRIFVSTAARAALSDEQWRAMLLHEESHIAHRDLRDRLLLELLLGLAAPLVGRRVRALWDGAIERLRDADAAQQSSPEAVASALVAMARATLGRRGAGIPALSSIASFAAATGASPAAAAGAASVLSCGGELGSIAQRVAALLEAHPRGEGQARRLAQLAWAGMSSLAIAAALSAGALHHTLETLLG